MIHSEYIRNLNCNYERILLEEKPEENRYQYCIVGRGGIKRLLSCSLRYINNSAYLYYDISSTQNLSQLYLGKALKREWFRDFLWAMKQVRLELERFLLDETNLLWYPEQIFQDLEKKDFSFLYIPYYEGDTGFEQLLDFWVEKADYEDPDLVECIYHFYEQYRAHGEVYLREQIFEDARSLDEPKREAASEEEKRSLPKRPAAWKEDPGKSLSMENQLESGNTRKTTDRMEETEGLAASVPAALNPEALGSSPEEDKPRKSFLYFWESRKKKQQEERDLMRQQSRDLTASYAVAENSSYASPEPEEEEYDEEDESGRTMYLEEKEEEKVYRLFSAEGKILCTLDRETLVIGKKREEADCVLTDSSISRLHARITREGEDFYLEDLNSTNGSFKNGLRLQPYEKRKIQQEDEIRLGKVVLIFR